MQNDASVSAQVSAARYAAFSAEITLSGDANGDKVLNFADAAAIQARSYSCEQAADVNHDGLVNQHDADAIIAGDLLVSHVPCTATDALALLFIIAGS